MKPVLIAAVVYGLTILVSFFVALVIQGISAFVTSKSDAQTAK
jgi:hypothetical protein